VASTPADPQTAASPAHEHRQHATFKGANQCYMLNAMPCECVVRRPH
jgi:hypothetical protein